MTRHAAQRARGSWMWLALLLLGTGCGSVHSIPIDQTATDIAGTVCSQAYRCCTLQDLMGNDSAGTGAGDCSTDTSACELACEQKTADHFRNLLSGVQSSVDRKRTVYEQTKVDACLRTIRSSSCETLNMTSRLTGVPGCDSFVTPLVALGDACGNDYECIGGWCKHTPGSSSLDGTCTAFVGAGASCATDQCQPGLNCDPKTKAADDDVCVQPGEVGAMCTDASECETGVCSASPGGKACAAATGKKCFYGGGCAAAGEGRPGLPALLLFAAFVTVLLARERRSQRAGISPAMGSVQTPSVGPQPTASRPMEPASNQIVPSRR